MRPRGGRGLSSWFLHSSRRCRRHCQAHGTVWSRDVRSGREGQGRTGLSPKCACEGTQEVGGIEHARAPRRWEAAHCARARAPRRWESAHCACEGTQDVGGIEHARAPRRWEAAHCPTHVTQYAASHLAAPMQSKVVSGGAAAACARFPTTAARLPAHGTHATWKEASASSRCSPM